jgi:signal recognition particle receptor subunit alpha
MVGVYLAEFCLLGLFGIGIGNSVTSAGPTVLQVILIVATIIFHIFTNRKLKQFNLHSHEGENNDAEAGRGVGSNDMHTANSNERQGSRRSDQALVSGVQNRVNRHSANSGSHELATPSNTPQQKSIFKRIFMPHELTPSQISASLAPRFRHPVAPYSEQEVLEAYLHPALALREEVIWLATDPAGVSKKEVAELKDGLSKYNVEVTDEGAIMNEKGKVEWDDESVTQAPLWDRKVVY